MSQQRLTKRTVPTQGLKGNELVLAERLNSVMEELCAAQDESQWNRLTIEALRHLGQSLDERFDVRRICSDVVSSLTDKFGVWQCSLMVADEDAATLTLEAGAESHRLPEDTAPGIGRTFRFGEGIAGEAAATRRIQIVPDVSLDTRWVAGVSGYPVRSLICVPLFGSGRLVGVLNMSHPEPNHYTGELVQKLESLCLIVGQLLAFAKLQENLIATKIGLERTVRSRESQMRETWAKLARREKLAALGETVSGLAHELNNRLLPITVYSESLLNSRLDEEQDKQVRVISSSAKGVRGLLDSLLSFSRQHKPSKQPVCLNELLEGIIAVVRISLKRDGIQLRSGLAPDMPRTMLDPAQLEQVMINLIRNAQHAILKQWGGRGGLIAVSALVQGESILIRVRDNGCGIPEEYQNKIMQPFFTTKPPGQGTGLGLSVCYGILSEHGGSIDVCSEPGDTTITLQLPVVKPEPEHGSITRRKSGPTELNTRLRVLIIDDEESILEVMANVLSGRVLLDTACSGDEAVDKLGENDYDVVVSDMRMPGMGGRDIYQWVVKNRPGWEQRIIFTTGDTFDPATYSFIQGKTCLPKPFTVNALLKAINTVALNAKAKPAPVMTT